MLAPVTEYDAILIMLDDRNSMESQLKRSLKVNKGSSWITTVLLKNMEHLGGYVPG